MRDVPDGHAAGELFRWKPVGQEPRARRKTHPLKPPVRHPDNPQSHDRRIESEEYVHQRGRAEAESHERACIGAITQKTIRELGISVKQSMQGEKQTQLSFLKTQT